MEAVVRAATRQAARGHHHTRSHTHDSTHHHYHRASCVADDTMGTNASKYGQYEANRGGLSPSVVELGAEASGTCL